MHICFSVTAHGFGHAAISSAVIAEIMACSPHIQCSILSRVPKAYFASRLPKPFTLLEVGSDFGMVSPTAIDIDIGASGQKYAALLANWDELVATEKHALRQLKPDLVVANISPICLAAASDLGIPAVSLAPFNWSQIYRRYCNDRPDAAQLLEKLDQSYQSVLAAVKPMPHVPDVKLAELEQEVGPISRRGNCYRRQLLEQLPDNIRKLGLLALGGVSLPVNLNLWPEVDTWFWLVDQAPPDHRKDMLEFKQTGIKILDLISSVDLVITKPGYGTYTEIALAGTKAITLARADWPETPYLNRFLSQHVSCAEITRDQLVHEEFTQAIQRVDSTNNPIAKPCQVGAEQCARLLIRLTQKHNRINKKSK